MKRVFTSFQKIAKGDSGVCEEFLRFYFLQRSCGGSAGAVLPQSGKMYSAAIALVAEKTVVR